MIKGSKALLWAIMSARACERDDAPTVLSGVRRTLLRPETERVLQFTGGRFATATPRVEATPREQGCMETPLGGGTTAGEKPAATPRAMGSDEALHHVKRWWGCGCREVRTYDGELGERDWGMLREVSGGVPLCNSWCCLLVFVTWKRVEEGRDRRPG